MSSASTNNSGKAPPLWFSREMFADYWTALESRVRQDDDCDRVYTGTMRHPLIELQHKNRDQIRSYNCELVTDDAMLTADPIGPTEMLIASIIVAAVAATIVPPLAVHWDDFRSEWTVYKRAQRKIYAIAIATLQVGKSMHYARAVAYGAGTQLLSTIYEDNRRTTTRSLFALFSSLFTLQYKSGETFQLFRTRFELIKSRFTNWRPPIVLPQELFLFCILRGLSEQPYGPTKHIILATANITLQRGLQLLSDISQTGANLIKETLGSGPSEPGAETSNLLALTASAQPTTNLRPPPPPPVNSKKKSREERKSAACKKYGPCTHHGPRSLHATCECKDPQLLRRKKKPATRSTVPVQHLSSSQMPWSHSANAYPTAAYPSHPMYPPMAYQPPNNQLIQPQASTSHIFQQPMSASIPSSEHAFHHMLIITVTPTQIAEASYDGDDEISDAEEETADTHLQFQICGRNRLQQLLLNMQANDREFWPIPACYDSETSDTEESASAPDSDASEALDIPCVPSTSPSIAGETHNVDAVNNTTPALFSDVDEVPRGVIAPLDKVGNVMANHDGSDSDYSHGSALLSDTDFSSFYYSDESEDVAMCTESEKEILDIPEPSDTTAIGSASHLVPTSATGDESSAGADPSYQPLVPATFSEEECSDTDTSTIIPPLVSDTSAEECSDSDSDSSEDAQDYAYIQACARTFFQQRFLYAPETYQEALQDAGTISWQNAIRVELAELNLHEYPGEVHACHANVQPFPAQVVRSGADTYIPGCVYTHTLRGNNFDVNVISGTTLDALVALCDHTDRYIQPDQRVVHPILVIKPGDNGDDPPPPTPPVTNADPPPPPPPASPSPASSSESTTAEEPALVGSQMPKSSEAASVFDAMDDILDDHTLLQLNPDIPIATRVQVLPADDDNKFTTPEKPQGLYLPPSTQPHQPVNDSSEYSPTLSYDPPPRLLPKPRRKFKGHGWSKKGTKASRKQTRAARSSSSVYTDTALDPPAIKTPRRGLREISASAHAHSALSASVTSVSSSTYANSSPVSAKCEHPDCDRYPAKRKYGTGYFRYCFHHRHLNSPAASKSPSISAHSTSTDDQRASATVSVRDITDHASPSNLSAELRQRSLDIDSSFPRLRRLRCTYAYAQGLHTVLHYHQQFLVTLSGEPALRDDWSVAPCMLTGNVNSAHAIRATLRHVTNPAVNPATICSHPGCVYGRGDLPTRRARHVAAIAIIDDIIRKQSETMSNINLVASSQCRDVILDSGAGRHLHNVRQDFTSICSCAPQTLTGFMGKHATVSSCGTVRGFDNVLFMPSSQASVRSVGCLLDTKGGAVTFTSAGAQYITPSGSARQIIAVRNASGLYSVLPNAMSVSSVPVLISVPTQVRREAVHRFHQCLGHVSIEKMRHVMRTNPSVCGSLTTRDLALFTSCPACRVGSARKATRPKSSYTRTQLFAHRLHADTTGVIRPATTTGFRRALVIVDDASRWIFIRLLRAASTLETSAAIRNILQEAAAGAQHILHTRIFRSDNGTEFVNSDVQNLLVQAGIQHERTCPHTSHQNGVAERAIGRLMPMVRTMMAAASARPTFWGEAIHAAAHILNRMPCSSNQDNVSPFQIRYGRVPHISHLQPWGITAYVQRLRQQNKLHRRADSGMLVGYGHDLTLQKGWRVYLPINRKIVTSSNVTFDASLDESLQRRQPSLRSMDLPEEEDPAPNEQRDVSTSADVPTLSHPHSSPPPPTLPHPLCTREAGSAPLVLSEAVSSSGPAASAQAHEPHRPVTRSSSSWADVVRKTGDEAVDNGADDGPPFTRPRGRPPANHSWDANKGEYVPINTCITAPAANSAWILAAMDSDLVARHVTPKTYNEAVTGPDAEHWLKAIQEELASLKKCAVWKAVVLPTISTTARAIPTKWVFKIKTDGHGHVARYKARLVVCGYRQKFGRDYTLTFAPVAHAASIRMVLAMAVSLKLCLRQFDVKTAFLYGDLPEDQRVYLLPPKGVNVPPGHVLALLKSMYGLKQAPLQWNKHLHTTLTKLRFQRNTYDPCVYRLQTHGGIVILAVVVDDILVAASHLALIQQFERDMKQVYQLTSLDVPKRLVGLNITITDDGLTIDQEQFVKDIASDFK